MSERKINEEGGAGHYYQPAYGPLSKEQYPEIKKRQNGEFIKVVGYLIGAGLLFWTGWTTLGWILIGGAALTFIFGWTYAQIQSPVMKILFLFGFIGLGIGTVYYLMIGLMGG